MILFMPLICHALYLIMSGSSRDIRRSEYWSFVSALIPIEVRGFSVFPTLLSIFGSICHIETIRLAAKKMRAPATTQKCQCQPGMIGKAFDLLRRTNKAPNNIESTVTRVLIL